MLAQQLKGFQIAKLCLKIFCYDFIVMLVAISADSVF